MACLVARCGDLPQGSSLCIDYQEFHRKSEFAVAKTLLETGSKRADQLQARQASWLKQKGLVVRGYRSKIDMSVQPYGLEIPESYSFEGNDASRLDFWFHGRGETLSELSFINQRSRSKGKIKPPKGIVLHPYGRYSNANKFAGEMDLFEALDHARKYYRIGSDRILVRGFSMGGGSGLLAVLRFIMRTSGRRPSLERDFPRHRIFYGHFRTKR